MPEAEQRLELYRHLLGKLTGAPLPKGLESTAEQSPAAESMADEAMSVSALGGMLPSVDDTPGGPAAGVTDDWGAATARDVAPLDPTERRLQILRAMLDQLNS